MRLILSILVLMLSAQTAFAQGYDKLSAEDKRYYEEEKKKLKDLKVEPLYYFPWEAGKRHSIMQGWFGKTTHSGPRAVYAIDFAFTPTEKVLAARSGVVCEVNKDQGEPANYLVIKHADGSMAAYGHFRDDGFMVKMGDKVTVGDHIGYCGPVEAHCHFVIWGNGKKGRVSYPYAFKEYKKDGGIPKEGATCISDNQVLTEAHIRQFSKYLEKAESELEKDRPVRALKYLAPVLDFAERELDHEVLTKATEIADKLASERDALFQEVEEKVKKEEFEGVENTYKKLKKAWSGSEWGKKATKDWFAVTRLKAYKDWKKKK